MPYLRLPSIPTIGRSLNMRMFPWTDGRLLGLCTGSPFSTNLASGLAQLAFWDLLTSTGAATNHPVPPLANSYSSLHISMTGHCRPSQHCSGRLTPFSGLQDTLTAFVHWTVFSFVLPTSVVHWWEPSILCQKSASLLSASSLQFHCVKPFPSHLKLSSFPLTAADPSYGLLPGLSTSVSSFT